MKKNTLAIAVIAVSFGAVGIYSTPSFAHGSGYGQNYMNDQNGSQMHGQMGQQGMMGQGMMEKHGQMGQQGQQGMMDKHGQMGQQGQQGMMGKHGQKGQGMMAMMSQHGKMGMMGQHGLMGGATELDLNADDVRKIIEGQLVMHGTDRLKVGKIEAVDEKVITAEIVTVDDSLVVKLQFDRKTGAHHPVK